MHAAQVGRLAQLHGITLRTGCFCNPGACAGLLGLTGEVHDAMHSMCFHSIYTRRFAYQHTDCLYAQVQRVRRAHECGTASAQPGGLHAQPT